MNFRDNSIPIQYGTVTGTDYQRPEAEVLLLCPENRILGESGPTEGFIDDGIIIDW